MSTLEVGRCDWWVALSAVSMGAVPEPTAARRALGRTWSPIAARCFQKLSPSPSFRDSGQEGRGKGGQGQGQLLWFSFLGFLWGVSVPVVTVFER